MLYGYSFIVYIKTDDIYKDFAEDIGARSDTLNYELDRQLPKGKHKKVIGSYSYLTDDSSEDKKSKRHKKEIKLHTKKT